MFYYSKSSVEEIVEHIGKVVRGSFASSLYRTKQRGDLETAAKMEEADRIRNERKALENYISPEEKQNYKRLRTIVERVNTNPSYAGVKIHEKFLERKFFHEWCVNQVGYNESDSNGKSFQIDKDILSGVEKIYGPETCVFIPTEINMFLTATRNPDRSLPLGVVHGSNVETVSYVAQCQCPFDTKVYRGSFATEEEAVQRYKESKELFAKLLALKWKYKIDVRVFNYLYDFTVTDERSNHK